MNQPIPTLLRSPRTAAELQPLRTAITAAIQANHSANVDSIARQLLAGLTDRLRRYLRELDSDARDLPDFPLPAGVWCENGHLPAIRDLIDQSARQRELGAVKQRAAA